MLLLRYYSSSKYSLGSYSLFVTHLQSSSFNLLASLDQRQTLRTIESYFGILYPNFRAIFVHSGLKTYSILFKDSFLLNLYYCGK